MKQISLFVSGLVLTSAIATAQNPIKYEQQWPQWCGPLANGLAPSANPPLEWSDTKNVRFKVAIPGRGNASPIIWGDDVFILTAVKKENTTPPPPSASTGAGGVPTKADKVPISGAEKKQSNYSGIDQHSFHGLQHQPPPAPPPGTTPPPDGPTQNRDRRGPPRSETPKDPYQFVVMAINRTTGATVWTQIVHEGVPHEGTHTDSTFASSSPITDGEVLIAYFGSYGLYALGLDGKLKWKTDLGDMHTRNCFGEGASPALYKNTVVVVWDHEQEDFIIALDKQTGSERWRVQRDEPTTWSTPLILEVDGRPQVIVNGTNRIRSYDLDSGKEIWQTGGMTTNVIPSPVAGNGLVFLMSGFRGAAARAIRLADAKGELSDGHPAIVWTFDKDTPYVPSPLLYDDGLYMLENNRAVLSRLDAATGQRQYGPQRLEGVEGVYASPVAASGRVYLVGRDGETVILKHSPTFEVLAKNQLDDSFSASPALAGDAIYLRGQEHLYCLAGN